jgi:hypothetical protein
MRPDPEMIPVLIDAAKALRFFLLNFYAGCEEVFGL